MKKIVAGIIAVAAIFAIIFAVIYSAGPAARLLPDVPFMER